MQLAAQVLLSLPCLYWRHQRIHHVTGAGDLMHLCTGSPLCSSEWHSCVWALRNHQGHVGANTPRAAMRVCSFRRLVIRMPRLYVEFPGWARCRLSLSAMPHFAGVQLNAYRTPSITSSRAIPFPHDLGESRFRRKYMDIECLYGTSSRHW